MSMTQHDGVHSFQIETQLARVAQKQIGLPGIEKQTPASDLDMKRQAVLGLQVAGIDAVFDQGCDAN
jgi:hypothetical protein